jgi:lia operon protein LiaG
VVIADVEGRVRAETSGGNVAVKVRGGNKGVHAETSGGNVEVFVAKDCAANLDASTSGGNVECDLPVTVVGKIKESSIKGTINGGGPLIYAHTSGGNVRIRPLE